MDIIHKTAAFYIRVSTDDQTEFSPEAQLRALKNYAENCGFLYNDSIIYIDEGFSAKSARRRPAFMEMISRSSQQPTPFDVILVHRFDRFARNREDSVIYKSLLKKRGIKVVSVTEHLEDDKFSLILESILEAMAEYYSLNLSDEVKKGMCEKARRGGLQSPPPLGYMVRGNVFVPCEPEAGHIRRMFELLMSGLTPPEIAAALNAEGVKTKKGSEFTSRAVRYILTNPVYTGALRWNCGGQEYLNHGCHEAIVSSDVFLSAQKRLSR